MLAKKLASTSLNAIFQVKSLFVGWLVGWFFWYMFSVMLIRNKQIKTSTFLALDFDDLGLRIPIFSMKTPWICWLFPEAKSAALVIYIKSEQRTQTFMKWHSTTYRFRSRTVDSLWAYWECGSVRADAGPQAQESVVGSVSCPLHIKVESVFAFEVTWWLWLFIQHYRGHLEPKATILLLRLCPHLSTLN